MKRPSSRDRLSPGLRHRDMMLSDGDPGRPRSRVSNIGTRAITSMADAGSAEPPDAKCPQGAAPARPRIAESRAWRARRLEGPVPAGDAGLVAALVGFSDHTPDLSHLRVGFLSGGERGNYYAIVSALAAEARRQKGRIDNLSSAGSVENVSRLTAGQPACDVHFALVQDGMEWPAGHRLELIGRLGKAESLVFLGRDADRVRSLADLRGKRIGVGPVGSGTERVARQVLAPLGELGMSLSTHSLEEQLAKLESGELDLGAMVIDEDARLLREAVRDRKLQILDLPAAEALARPLPFAHVGRIAVRPVRSTPPAPARATGAFSASIPSSSETGVRAAPPPKGSSPCWLP